MKDLQSEIQQATYASAGTLTGNTVTALIETCMDILNLMEKIEKLLRYKKLPAWLLA